ncbi:MAG: hypothetical protein DSY89_11170 [Deltaproteobacteria bacterium]|nr:MAG: hypothetical protein DSY89_11170 [Deltaproteobacteria bacterium]
MALFQLIHFSSSGGFNATIYKSTGISSSGWQGMIFQGFKKANCVIEITIYSKYMYTKLTVCKNNWPRFESIRRKKLNNNKKQLLKY